MNGFNLWITMRRVPSTNKLILASDNSVWRYIKFYRVHLNEEKKKKAEEACILRD